MWRISLNLGKGAGLSATCSSSPYPLNSNCESGHLSLTKDDALPVQLSLALSHQLCLSRSGGRGTTYLKLMAGLKLED